MRNIHLFVLMGLAKMVLGSDPLSSYWYYDACGCQCTEDKLFTGNNGTFGNCEFERDGKIGCYLHEVVSRSNKCKDQLFDAAAGAYWSSDACFTPAYYEFPCTTTTAGTCRVKVKDETVLECENSKEKRLGLEINCNVANPACDCFDLHSAQGLKKLFGPGAQLDCIAGAGADRVSFTTSAGGLASVRVRRTWKRKRNCVWVRGQNDQINCVSFKNEDDNNEQNENNDNNDKARFDEPPIWSN